MSEQSEGGSGSRKVKMAAIGGVLTAILGAIGAFTGASIGVEVYATIGAIFGTAMVGNGMEHIGQGIGARGSDLDASSVLSAVTGLLGGAATPGPTPAPPPVEPPQ